MSVPDFIALISGMTGIVTAIGVLIANVQLNKTTAATLDLRLTNVETKLDEHNEYATKLTSIEKAIVAIQKDIEFLKDK